MARGLVKSYRGRRVVDDVHLEVSLGEVVGLLGPNGAGKTTTFNMVVGLVPAEAGSVSLAGLDLTPLPIHLRARAGLGYLPQEASHFPPPHPATELPRRAGAGQARPAGTSARRPPRPCWRNST